jgi:alpha-L-arabinofuranosidase
VADQPFGAFPTVNGAKPTVYTKDAPQAVSSGMPWNFSGGDPVTVTVDAGNVLRAVNPYVFGVNAVIWSGRDWLLDPDRIDKAKQAGLRFWRLPGGSASDTYHWDGNTHGRTLDNEGRNPLVMNDPSFVHTDDFIEFCQRVGAEAIVTVNYGCARYDGVDLAADMAARWVQYFNVTKKFKVRYWEVGNEPYGNWEDGNQVAGQPPMTGAIYGQDYQVIAAAMRKVDPDIFIGAPAVRFDTGNSYDGYGWWMRDMLGAIDGKVDFLFQHYYFGGWPYDGSNKYIPPTYATFWNDLHQVADTKTNSLAMMAKYTQHAALPVAFTEFNLVESPVESIELFNGLYTAEVLGEQLRQGFAAANIWDWQNGLTDKNGGDHGLLATQDPAVPDATPRPPYYTYAIFHRAFGDSLLAASTSAEPQVKVLASRFAGGELGLVVVNRGETPAELHFQLNGFTPKGPTNGWILTGDSLDARLVTWNEVAGPSGGGGPFPLDSIAPYVGDLGTQGQNALTVPPRSLTGVVIY